MCIRDRYLRDYRAVTYASAGMVAASATSGDAVLILAGSTLAQNPSLGEAYVVSRRYVHRWWFPEQGYRAVMVGGVFHGLIDGSLLADWYSSLDHGVDPSTLGMLNGVVFFPEES